MKKVLSVILSVIMLLSIVPLTASAETYSGTCGENATWAFDDATGTLTISGAGEMRNYGFENRSPWRSYEEMIKEVIVSDGITTIGEMAFMGCYNLTSVIISDSVTSIGNSAFAYCTSLTSVIIGNGVTTISGNAFYNCDSLTGVTIPDSVTTIDYCAFYGCESLASVTVPNSVTSIGHGAFDDTTYYNDLNNWENNNVLYIGNHLMEAKTTLSGDYAIKDGTITIVDIAFMGCDKLTSITIPDSVTTIGNTAFYDCDGLTDVYYSGSKREWKKITIGKNNENLIGSNIHYNADYNGELCDHSCHKGGLVGFFWQITLFFSKLFRSNQYCECGVEHY